MELITFLLELIIVGASLLLFYRRAWRGYGKIARIAAAVLSVCVLFVSFSGEGIFKVPKRTITVTALQDKAPQAENTQIYLKDVLLNDKPQGVPEPAEGQWSWYNGQYCWFEDGDERRSEETTSSVTVELPVCYKTSLEFTGNRWKGMASVTVDGENMPVDTFCDTDDSTTVTVQLPPPDPVALMKTDILPLLGFALCMAVGCSVSVCIVGAGRKLGARRSISGLCWAWFGASSRRC